MKYAIVTGAYGGMGYATVSKLIKNGYTVFALDKNVKDAIENVIPIRVDLTDINSVKQAYQVVCSITKTIDAIVHFAGIYMLDSLVEISADDFKKILDVNFYSVYLVNKTFFPLLISGSKIMITTSELAPLSPLPFTGIYAISKSALDNYAYSLKMELQLLGVQVSVLRAGAVSTGMLGVSTSALERFCANTKLYQCNAVKFKQIVDGVEAKNVSPDKIALKTYKILKCKKPKFAYKINRNKLLLLLNSLPSRIQFAIIRKILKKKDIDNATKE